MIAAKKLRVAQAEAKDLYKSYSAANKATTEVNKRVLKIRADLAAEEAKLLDCQSQVMEAHERHRIKDAEVAKWDHIIRLKHLQVMELGRSSGDYQSADTRLAVNMMVEECLLAENVVQSAASVGATCIDFDVTADLAREEASKAKKWRLQVEQEQKEAEKLRKAVEAEKLRKAKEEKLRKAAEAEKLRKAEEEKLRKAAEVEKLRKAEIARKAKEAETARARAAAASEERQRQQLAETESNLQKQLNDIQLQKRRVSGQQSLGARPKESVVSNEVAGAERLRVGREPARTEGPRDGESNIQTLNRLRMTDVGKDPLPRDSRQYW